jgi:hypothetical protein
VNLSQGEVLHFGGDFFGRKTEVVPPGDAAYRDTGAGDAWPAFANFRRRLDKSPNIHSGSHAAFRMDRDGDSRARNLVVIVVTVRVPISNIGPDRPRILRSEQQALPGRYPPVEKPGPDVRVRALLAGHRE